MKITDAFHLKKNTFPLILIDVPHIKKFATGIRINTSVLIVLGFVFCHFQLRSQNTESRIPLIGEEAPAFIAQSTKGTLHFPGDFGKDWKILFSHPADFTPVCTSEIMELALMQQDFTKLGVRIAVLSADDLDMHESWVKSMEGMLGKNNSPVEVEFPLIDDSRMEISRKYGMVSTSDHAWKTIRGVFIIDPENKVQAIFYYPKNIGRNLEEIRRTIIALQTSAKYTVLTPVNWKEGDEVLLPYPYPYNYQDSLQSNSLGYHDISWYMLFKKLDK